MWFWTGIKLPQTLFVKKKKGKKKKAFGLQQNHQLSTSLSGAAVSYGIS